MLATLSTIALALLGTAAAQIQIISPSTDIFWVAQSFNNLVWTGTSPQMFTVFIANPNTQLLSDKTALVATLEASRASYSMTPGSAPAGTGYTIQFTDITNSSNIYAESQPFELKALGASYPTVSPSALASTSSGGAVSSGTAVSSTSAASSGTPATSSGAAVKGMRGDGWIKLGALGLAGAGVIVGGLMI